MYQKKPTKVVVPKSSVKKHAAKKPLALKTRSRSLAQEPKKLELFTKSIVEQYSQDPTFPCIHLSFLINTKEYYVSIVRFKDQWAKGAFTVASARGNTQNEALSKLFNDWMAKIVPSKDATAELIRMRENSNSKGDF